MRLSKRAWLIVAVLVAALAVLWQQQFASHNTPSSQPALTHLTAEGMDALRTQFNDAASSVRMIVLLSPT